MIFLNYRIIVGLLVVFGILIVGFLDYVTGIEIRIFPLYFFPLVLAAHRFGKWGALAASISATTVWFLSNYLGGHVFSRWYVWPLNVLTQGMSFLVVSLLVSSLHSAIIREKEVSQTDSLTGLLNSRAFHAQTETSLSLCHRNRRPVTVAFMDLDNFKNVNDIAGHQQGDELLREVAISISNSLRASDIVARIGGDEFAIFLPELDASNAKIVLNKIKDELNRNAMLIKFSVSASIGAAVYEEAPARRDEMLQHADALMYSVKSSGKNGINIKIITSEKGKI